jgi:Regulator of chromosome condensation (RCC1) repeat
MKTLHQLQRLYFLQFVLYVSALLFSSLSLAQAPTLVTTQLQDAYANTPYSASIMVGGTPPPTSIIITGLPAGLSATHNGSGSVAISGTATIVGNYTVALNASNTAGTKQLSVPLNVITTQAQLALYAVGATVVAAGEKHSCAVVNGGVQCWGNNNSGQLGVRLIVAQTFVELYSSPVEAIPQGSGATSVAVGLSHSCAVVEGGLMCWGEKLGYDPFSLTQAIYCQRR